MEVLKLGQAPESHIEGLHSWVSDLVDFPKVEICISNKYPEGADAASLEPHFWNHSTDEMKLAIKLGDGYREVHWSSHSIFMYAENFFNQISKKKDYNKKERKLLDCLLQVLFTQLPQVYKPWKELKHPTAILYHC